jgi:hypothetical protein
MIIFRPSSVKRAIFFPSKPVHTTPRKQGWRRCYLFITRLSLNRHAAKPYSHCRKSPSAAPFDTKRKRKNECFKGAYSEDPDNQPPTKILKICEIQTKLNLF